MNKVLEIKHCNKSFGENEVLKDISLSVTEGQVVSIIGPSGSGKSTLLRCATMLETMDGGDLIYLGDYAAKADAQGKAVYAAKETLQGIKKHFGLVFQNFNLFPHYYDMKNITEPPILIGRRKKEWSDGSEIHQSKPYGKYDTAHRNACGKREAACCGRKADCLWQCIR